MTVSARIFFTDPDYLGGVVQSNIGELHPKIFADLLECCDGDWPLVVMSGARGYGKSTFITLAMLYKVYKLMLMNDPIDYYKAQDSIKVFILSETQIDAKRRIKNIYNLISQSPFFGGRYEYNNGLGGIKIHGSIKILPSIYSAGLLSEDIFMAVFDTTKLDGYKLDGLSKRITRKYGKEGTLYIACEPSQLDNLPDGAFLRNYAVWDVREEPEGTKTFKVLANRGPSILTNKDEIKIVEVPETYRLMFEKDVEGCLRDIAGLPTINK